MKGNTPQKPRRWSPLEAKSVIGRIWIPSMLLAMLAIAVRSLWLLLPAFVLWVVMLAILFAYWRCPHCGKGLPKTGKISACPRCGEEIH